MGEFFPTYSTDNIWREDNMEQCLSNDLTSIETNIAQLQANKANVGHVHTGYASAYDMTQLQALVGDTSVATQIANAPYAPASLIDEYVECTAETETAKLTEVFTAMSVQTTKRVCVNLSGAVWIWDIFKASATYGVVKAWKYGHYGNPDSKERNFFNGSWQDWAWVNPPMLDDVEYLTTERWRGNPVYTRLVNCGLSENNKGVNITSFGATSIVRYSGTIWGTIPLPYIHSTMDNAWSIWLTVRPEQITMYCGSSRAGGTVRVQLWYTKS